MNEAATVAADSTLLVGRLKAAELCDISPASWDRLNNAGKIPAPVTLGRRVLWKRTDLVSWIEFGCPDRRTFNQLIGDR